MSSIFRRLISSKINSSPILRRRNLCTAATNVLRRPSPCLMLPPHYIDGGRDMVYNFYSPMKDEILSFSNKGGKEETRLMQDDKSMLVGSSHGWLGFYNTRNRGMCLLSPFSGRRIDLPPLAGEPFFREDTPWKLIMSCHPEEEECRAVVILGGNLGRRAAFCCPGRSRRWTPLGEWHRYRGDDDADDDTNSFTGFPRYYEFDDNDSDLVTVKLYRDFVYSVTRKRFVALVYSMSRKISAGQETWDSGNEVEYWDISDPSCPRMDRAERVGPHLPDQIEDPYIVCGEEPDQLFYVRQRLHNRKTGVTDAYPDEDGRAEDFEFHYDVYRIGDSGGSEMCSSLDDHAVFVGLNPSIAMRFSPKLFSPKLKYNCIYFADPRKQGFDGQYIDIFDYHKRRCSPLYFPNRHLKDKFPMTWITFD